MATTNLNYKVTLVIWFNFLPINQTIPLGKAENYSQIISRPSGTNRVIDRFNIKF